jgi:hypothetical protein
LWAAQRLCCARYARAGGRSHLSPRSNERLENRRNAYRSLFDELRLSGFVEGQNLKVDGGGYGLRDEQLPEIVAAMAKSPPDVIFCNSPAEMRAAQGAIRAVPIVPPLWSAIAS